RRMTPLARVLARDLTGMRARMAVVAAVGHREGQPEPRGGMALRARDARMRAEQRHPRVLAIVVVEARLRERRRPALRGVAAIARQHRQRREAVRRLRMTRAAQSIVAGIRRQTLPVARVVTVVARAPAVRSIERPAGHGLVLEARDATN